MKKNILACTAILLSFASFAQTYPDGGMMNHNSSGMYWGMGYWFWIISIIIIVAIMILLMDRRRKSKK